jgi:hypothetical protein
VNVDPAEAVIMQLPITNKLYDLTVRDRVHLMYTLIGGQELSAASAIADEEFPVN